MRAIKIDVVQRDIYEVDIDSTYQAMCQQLESDGYDGIRLSSTEHLWVDDIGLIKDNPIGAFRLRGYPRALSGHGLIIGLNGPESVASQLPLDMVRAQVVFVGVDELEPPFVQIYEIKSLADLIKDRRN